MTGDLGNAYFNEMGEDPARLQATQPLNAGTDSQITSLKVRAFPWKAVTYSTDEQVIFVIVQDQTLQPIQSATGQATIKWTNGAVSTMPILTNEKGVATLSIPVNNQTYGGLVTVDVTVAHVTLNGQATTSFRIWY